MVTSVLLVDDDVDIRDTVAEALRGAGYKVRVTSNGAQALTALEEMCPEVVLLDLMMPLLGGWQLLEIMKANPRHAQIPVIIMTASRDDVSGHPRVLRKPFGLDELLRTVAAASG
jgi:CheY-like chemotaxis protein